MTRGLFFGCKVHAAMKPFDFKKIFCVNYDSLSFCKEERHLQVSSDVPAGCKNYCWKFKSCPFHSKVTLDIENPIWGKLMIPLSLATSCMARAFFFDEKREKPSYNERKSNAYKKPASWEET